MTRNSQAGFTLLELLVSLTLLGFLFVLLFGGLRFGTRAWERSDSTSDSTRDVLLAQSIVRREIERACPIAFRVAGSDVAPAIDFSGTATSVMFRGPAPGSLGAAACTRVTLAIRPDGAA